MATEPKPTYSTTFTFKSSRPDVIAQALEHLQELSSESDESGEASAKLTIESFHERALADIREAFERWLFQQDVWIECEVTTKAPGLRPETRDVLMRAKRETPMDRIAGFAERRGASVEFRVAGEE